LTPSIGEGEALAGMVAGLATMTVVWAATPVAFTWYVFIGASTTCLVAWITARLVSRPVVARAEPPR
jgi:hypothetical protein